MASKRRIRRKACGAKQRFTSQEDAIMGLRCVVRAGKAGTGWLVPYRCQFCGGFHFGHRNRE